MSSELTSPPRSSSSPNSVFPSSCISECSLSLVWRHLTPVRAWFACFTTHRTIALSFGSLPFVVPVAVPFRDSSPKTTADPPDLSSPPSLSSAAPIITVWDETPFWVFDGATSLGLLHLSSSAINAPSDAASSVSTAMKDGVFLLPGCCDPFNEKALRASRGASFQLPVVSGSWNHLESLKKEFQMRFLAGHPEHEGLVKPVSSLSPSFCDSLSDTPLCLVLGSEGSGLSEKSLQTCELVSIAMTGEYESLNVSVAGGIFLYMLQPKNP
ncbi:uncharacterized protein LOC114423045 isoform X3 [Glycine soja]|uniref:uncharacterized protein LOC114423045 isoform X3 n=1 Tax=Glycine soja TaxID=3848 RepID=UPI001040D7A0|nr:uncharacterized protein LOC114423045 isoform X3 [Glycine soja]